MRFMSFAPGIPIDPDIVSDLGRLPLQCIALRENREGLSGNLDRFNSPIPRRD